MKKEKNTTPSGEDYLEAILILQRQKGLVRGRYSAPYGVQ